MKDLLSENVGQPSPRGAAAVSVIRDAADLQLMRQKRDGFKSKGRA
jgi:hypothetical protein